MAKPQLANQDEPSNESEPSASSRPAARFSGSGGLSVAVWKHKADDGRERYSIRMDRSYKDDKDEYQSTPYLRDSDLLRAQKLLDEADAWVEQDKAKHRASGKSSEQSR